MDNCSPKSTFNIIQSFPSFTSLILSSLCNLLRTSTNCFPFWLSILILQYFLWKIFESRAQSVSYATSLRSLTRLNWNTRVVEFMRSIGGARGGWIERIERISCTFLHTVAHDTYKIQTLYTEYYCILHVRRSRATIHHICTNTFALKRTITRT